MVDGDDMNKEVKKQLILSFVLLALLMTTLFFWYPNFVFHTYVETLDYQYCLSGTNDELAIDGYEIYQDGKTQGYGHARMISLKPDFFQKGDDITLTLVLSDDVQLTQSMTVENDHDVIIMQEQKTDQILQEDDIQKAQLQVEIVRDQKEIYSQSITMKNQDMLTYTGANKDYSLTNVYVTSSWLKTGIFSSKNEDIAKEYPYMIVDYLYLKDQDGSEDINDYERFVYMNGKTEDFLTNQMKNIGYYDGEESLLDMNLCCVITLMKEENDTNPYTFILPLNPVQKGE